MNGSSLCPLFQPTNQPTNQPCNKPINQPASTRGKYINSTQMCLVAICLIPFKQAVSGIWYILFLQFSLLKAYLSFEVRFKWHWVLKEFAHPQGQKWFLLFRIQQYYCLHPCLWSLYNIFLPEVLFSYVPSSILRNRQL